MTLEKIVELYGSSRSIHLVSRRVKIRKEGPFKGVKTYRIELWDVDKHQIIGNAEKTCLMTLENKDAVIGEIEQELVKIMFEVCP